MRCVVIMGVAGCGKSSVGEAAAERLGATYIDGDDLHPQSNIDKMARGEPLTDEDRAPWLDCVGDALRMASGQCLIGCSALKRIYRDRIRNAAGEPVSFVHLTGTREVIKARMQVREGHFMPVSLLDSQFAALEPPGPDERAIAVDIDQPLAEVVNDVVMQLAGMRS